MSVVYAKLADPQGVPPLDPSQFETRQIGSVHCTLMYTTGKRPQTAESWFSVLNMSLNKEPMTANIVNAYSVQDKGLTAYGVQLTDVSRQRVAPLINRFKEDGIMAPNATIGDANDQANARGSLHMTMYFLPAREEMQVALLQEMQRLATPRPEIKFGSAAWSRKESMTKISFQKVGVDEYRRHLAGLSDDGVVEAFTYGYNDENVDEFGKAVSAAELALDEWAIRKAVLDPTDESERGKMMSKFARNRGIDLGSDEDIFR